MLIWYINIPNLYENVVKEITKNDDNSFTSQKKRRVWKAHVVLAAL